MKKVIVAPLNWGLGHASRCVPIIKHLIENNFTPILASDGKALKFLSKEFPDLETVNLPSYHISYGKNLKWNLLKKTPRINSIIKKEKRTLEEFLEKNKDVVGIISDNRFGMFSKKIPSVYITHQVNVLSGFLTSLTSFFHQRIIKNYKECWIPDEPISKFSGKLSSSNRRLNQKYIGILSRLNTMEIEKTIDILIVLSGPEPNRSLLESKLQQIFKKTQKNTWLVRGVIEEEQRIEESKNLKIVNFMLSEELEKAMNAAKLIICRSGYSSIMDLIALNKQAILIPTKGQSEQEYLAKHIQDLGHFKFVKEKDIDESILKLSAGDFKSGYEKKELNSNLFSLFQE